MRVEPWLLAAALVCLDAQAAPKASDPAALPSGALLRLGSASPRLGAGVTDYCYLPDGRVVMIKGGTIELHDLAEAGLLATYRVSKTALNSLTLRPDGHALLLTDRLGTVWQWDLAANAQLSTWTTGQKSLACAVYSPDAQRVLTLGVQPFTLKQWDLQSGKEMLAIDKAGGMVEFARALFAPDGKTAWVCGGVEHVLEQYDLTAGQCVASLLKGYFGYTMELSPDGKRLLVGSRSFASEWDLATQKLLQRFAGHHGGAVNALAYCRNPDQILTGSRDGSIRLWDRRKAKVLDRWFIHQGTVQCIRVSPDGKWMLSQADGRLVETNLDSGQPRRPPQGHNAPVSSAVLLPDRHAASAAEDGSICVWDLASGKTVRTWQASLLGIYSLAAVSGGRQLAVGCGDGQVRLYETQTGKLLKELPVHSGFVRAVISLPGGNRFVTSADDGSILVHTLDADSPPLRLLGHRGGVLALAASPDGNRLLSGGRDCSVRLWDLHTGKLLATCDDAHPGWVLSVCFSADGQRGYSGARDGRIVEWNLEAAKPFREFAQEGTCLALQASPDGQLYCALATGIIARWDLATGKRTAQLKGHRAAARTIALTSDARQLLSASSDSTLLVWDLAAADKPAKKTTNRPK
jgi:WD40 repeat protein